MADRQGAGSQAGQQGQGSGSQTSQGGQQGTQQQQSLGDQVYGAETGDSTQGQQTQQQGNQTGSGVTFEGMKAGETVEQYVTRINSELGRARQDAGRYRTDLRKYQGDEQQGDDGLTEFQRLQNTVGQLTKDLTAEREARKGERTSSALVTALANSGAVNPSRAMRLIDAGDLELGADGTPTAESVANAVAGLQREMPQIFTDVRGSGDGGAGNQGQGDPQDFNAQIRARAGARRG